MRHSIKLRLTVAFIGLAIGPLLAAGILVAWQTYKTQKAQAVQIQREIGQRISDQTTALIDKAEAQLVVMSKDLNIVQGAEAGHDISLLTAGISSGRIFEEMALADTRGQVVSHISKSTQSTSEQLADRFQADGVLIPSIANTGNYGPVRFNDAGEPSLSIAVPLVDKRTGAVDGFVVGIVRLKVAWELIGQIRVGETGSVYVVDDQNRVIAHRNPSVVLRGTEISPPKQDGFGTGLNGDKVVISSQKVPIGRQMFQVITEKPVSEAMSLTIRSAVTTSVILLGALVVAGVMAVVAIRFIVHPINKLATAAKALQDGDLSQRVEVTTNDELGTLGGYFNAMADQIVATIDSLAHRNAELQREITFRHAAEITLEKQAQELARSNQELEQFANIAYHDLQEPLRMVSSYTQLLEHRFKNKLDSDAHEFIGYAVDGAKRMQVQIDDLLAYSRVTTQGNSFEATNCSDIFETAVRNLAASIEESGAVVTRGPLPTVPADASQLISVFQNLISNGIKYQSDQPPRIHVSAVVSANECLLSFSDNGIGIEAQFAERIFVIFQRLHTKTECSGTGIGLAICKKVIERHGGRIWVESDPGKGSTFYCTLPIKNQVESQHEKDDQRMDTLRI